MSKVTLLKEPVSGSFIVVKDGVQTRCANLPPVFIQGKMGNTEMMFLPCVTNCPKCNVTDKTLTISCNGTESRFEIEEAVKPVETKKSGLIAVP